MTNHDVVIVGGGPSGLAAALTFGRARKRALLLDAGPRRNAAATHVHNFLTRDGTPPDEMRALARRDLAKYPSIAVRDEPAVRISGERGAFVVGTPSGDVRALRILLCTGVIDEMLPIDGFRELWGHAIFQCPYCHGWEVRERPWGFLAREPAALEHAALYRAWTDDLVVFTNGELAVPDAARASLKSCGIALEERRIVRLGATGDGDGDGMNVVLEGGSTLRRAVLVAHPPQRQVEVVAALGLELDEHGFVRVDPMKRETSRPGIYAAGDLTTRMQAAVAGAAAGMQTAAFMNFEITAESLRSGTPPPS
jgi:thioredoxin reductase